MRSATISTGISPPPSLYSKNPVPDVLAGLEDLNPDQLTLRVQLRRDVGRDLDPSRCVLHSPSQTDAADDRVHDGVPGAVGHELSAVKTQESYSQ